MDPEEIARQQREAAANGPFVPTEPDFRDVTDDDTGETYTVHTAPNGPYGGSLPEGTVYQVGNRSGTMTIKYTPPRPTGGTSVTVNPADTTGAWSIQYDSQGNGFKINKITGEVIPLDFDKTPGGAVDPRDKDGNGIDDSTGMAVGVYRYADSPTGFALGSGQPVWPDGSAYTGADAAEKAPDLVNGKYIWDPVAKKFVIAPGFESTGAANTSGLSGSTAGFNAIKAAASGGYGSSGGSAASTRDYIGEIQAKSDADAAYLDKKFALDKELALLEHAFKTDPNNPDYVLRRQALEAQIIQNEQQNRLQALKDFESAVSSPDMARLNARRLALGGDSTTASLLQDGGNFRENSAAAELLAMIRGMGSNNALGQVVANAAGAANPATQQTANTPMPMTPLPAAGGTGAPATPATPAPEPQGTFEQRLNQQLMADTSWARRADEKYAAEMRARLDPAQWVARGNGQVYQNLVTGEKITAQEYAQLVTYVRDSTTADPVNAAGGIMAGTGGLGDYYVRPVSANQGDGNINAFGQLTSPLDPLGQMQGTASQNFSPDWINYQAPSTKAQTGAENLTTIGRLIETDAAPVVGGAGGPNPAEEPVGNRAVLPMVAYGAHRPMRGPAIVGDPQADGRPNPEVVQWTPRGNVVMPMRSLPPQTQAMAMRAMPKFAYGSYADVQSALSGGIGEMPDMSAYQPKTTSRVSYTDRATQQQTAPVAPAPAPVVQPAPVAPVPAPAPVPMPMQPLPPAPVATAPVVTQPAPAPAPVATQPAPVSQPAPQPAPTATTAPPAPAPAPQTVQTVGSGSVPTSPTSDPLNPTALTPEALALYGEIDGFREDQPLADVNTLDSAFLRAAPSFQTGVLAAKQTRYGIPVDDWANEIARFQLRGRPTMTAVGY